VWCVSEGVSSSLYRSVGVTLGARFTEPSSTRPHRPPGIDDCWHEQVGLKWWPGGHGRAPGTCARVGAPQAHLHSAASLLGLDHNAKVGLAWFYAALACCSSLAFLRLPGKRIFDVFQLYLVCIPA
jgi:hypothetical protein